MTQKWPGSSDGDTTSRHLHSPHILCLLSNHYKDMVVLLLQTQFKMNAKLCHLSTQISFFFFFFLLKIFLQVYISLKIGAGGELLIIIFTSPSFTYSLFL